MQNACRNHRHSRPFNNAITNTLELEERDHHSNSNTGIDCYMLDIAKSYSDPNDHFPPMTSSGEEEYSSRYQSHKNKTSVTIGDLCSSDLQTNDDLSSNCSDSSWSKSERQPRLPFLQRVFSFLQWLVCKVVGSCPLHRREPTNPIQL